MIKVNDDVFKYYFYFVQERMNIFWNKYDENKEPLTDDLILKENKFTKIHQEICGYNKKNKLELVNPKPEDVKLWLEQ